MQRSHDTHIPSIRCCKHEKWARILKLHTLAQYPLRSICSKRLYSECLRLFTMATIFRLIYVVLHSLIFFSYLIQCIILCMMLTSFLSKSSVHFEVPPADFYILRKNCFSFWSSSYFVCVYYSGADPSALHLIFSSLLNYYKCLIRASFYCWNVSMLFEIAILQHSAWFWHCYKLLILLITQYNVLTVCVADYLEYKCLPAFFVNLLFFYVIVFILIGVFFAVWSWCIVSDIVSRFYNISCFGSINDVITPKINTFVSCVNNFRRKESASLSSVYWYML